MTVLILRPSSPGYLQLPDTGMISNLRDIIIATAKISVVIKLLLGQRLTLDLNLRKAPAGGVLLPLTLFLINLK